MAALTAMTAAIAVPCTAAPPVVQGPEAVADWNAAGQAFIASGQRLRPNTRRAKNIILFVGDGMGISTQTAARILEGQLNGRPGEENRLSFETLPYSALSKTYSWDQQTSDSAPTMTAMSTGYKAREGMLSVNHLTPRGECNATVNRAHALKTIDNGTVLQEVQKWQEIANAVQLHVSRPCDLALINNASAQPLPNILIGDRAASSLLILPTAQWPLNDRV